MVFSVGPCSRHGLGRLQLESKRHHGASRGFSGASRPTETVQGVFLAGGRGWERLADLQAPQKLRWNHVGSSSNICIALSTELHRVR